jgi:5-formyltetrahydrofolate cyclo-ligase
MDKKEPRRMIKEKKAALTPEQIRSYSEKVCRILIEQDFYKQAKVIFPYVAYNQEIRTETLIEDAWRQGKIVAVPKVVGENMVFLRLDSFDQLEIGYCNIPEPVSGEPVQAKQILMLMPGLAFDRDFNRIGYGGGFYDRYLDQMQDCEIFKVSFAYDFQLVASLPVEEHDYKIDALVTAEGCRMATDHA